MNIIIIYFILFYFHWVLEQEEDKFSLGLRSKQYMTPSWLSVSVAPVSQISQIYREICV